MMRNVLRVGIAILLSGSLYAPSAQANHRVYVRIGPPAPIVETRPVAPSRGLVWRPGYHRWHDGRYEWVGFHSQKVLPREIDPSRGYVATSNEMNLPPGPHQALNIGYEFTDPSRAQDRR